MSRSHDHKAYPRYRLTEQQDGRWSVQKRDGLDAPWIERPTLYASRGAAERALPAGRRLTAEVFYQPRFDSSQEAYERTVRVLAGLIMAAGADDTVDEALVVARGGCPKTLAARRDDVISAAQRQCNCLRAA